MNSFSAFFRAFRVDPSQAGYSQACVTSNEEKFGDFDALSASVNLDDIIDEYDEPSRRSRATNDNSNTVTEAGYRTQSYFSLNNAAVHDEETTSFYSALQDGFSLDDFELRSKYAREFLWNTSCNNHHGDERSIMLSQTEFQVFWSDLTYTVRPRATVSVLLDDFKNKLVGSLSSAPTFFNYCKTRTNHNVTSKASISEVESQIEPITILKNVNGSFKSGELTAIMGPSGAGKTSLLNILSRRREDGFTGRVEVNEANHKIKINAIPQDDHLLECLTVRENLLFASRLKNTHQSQDHVKMVNGVSNLLGLDDCLDTRTGNISGGQQKRLAIAQELLSKPDILILDEPTSGLDSMTCLKTLTVLKDLVKASQKKMIEPIAIVLTIHQPQRNAFELFDKVYVLANGGRTIYNGHPNQCVSFIEKYSGLKLPSPDYNPATYLIEIASGEFGQAPIDALASQVRKNFQSGQDKVFNDKLGSVRKSISLDLDQQSRHHLKRLDAIHGSAKSVIRDNLDRISLSSSNVKSIQLDPSKPLFLDPRLVKSSSIDTGKFFLKTQILTARCWKSLWRDPNQVFALVLFHLLLPFGMALMMGTKPGTSNACPKFSSEYSMKNIVSSDEYISQKVQDNFLLSLENMAIFFVTIYAAISANIAAMTLMFALDMKSCLKEYHNGWYSSSSYVFARILSNLPVDLALKPMIITLTYIATGQDTGNGQLPDVYRIIITALAIVIGSSIGQIMGMMFGAIYVGHITTALFASQGATLPFVLLSGFVMRTKNMSKLVRLLCMTSLYKHCLDITFVARYAWNVCGCNSNEVVDKQVVITGVPDRLRNFIKYWMSTQDKEVDPNDQSLSNPVGTFNSTTDNDDVFKIVAKQISLYNTYGIEVKSCDQVIPYQLYDFGLSEKDLPSSFAALVTLLLIMLVSLLLVVKFVMSYRTSL